MGLRKRGRFWYGDSQTDIRDEIVRFGKLNEYVPTRFADARCSCGCFVFRLQLDEAAGAAVRVCTGCSRSHPIGDSEEYLSDAELEECECPCGGEQFEITAGVHLYADSQSVKWLYVGGRCPACGLKAVYGDWKNEFEDVSELLARV